MVYLNARFYNPSLGVFQTRDPVQGIANRPETFNAYGYVQGNPITYTDRSGKCIDPVSFFICVAVGSAIIGAITGAAYNLFIDQGLSRGQVNLKTANWGEAANTAEFGANIGLLVGPTAAIGVTAIGTYGLVNGIGYTASQFGIAITGGVSYYEANSGAIDEEFNAVTEAYANNGSNVTNNGGIVDSSAAAEDAGGVANASNATRRLPVKDLHYTQDYVNEFSTDKITGNKYGYSVFDNAQHLIDDPSWDIPAEPIRVFRYDAKAGLEPRTFTASNGNVYSGNPANLQDGMLYSLDNRRLLAYQIASPDGTIPVQILDLSNPNDYQIIQNSAYEFSTQNFGSGIFVRANR